ncbi:hypothetical protein B0J11DRAFT_306723 [Dendryphion nanum]|uniref:Uncharacterized protein n=1 Tax=Dendryphion nanum TaxID=256645 RepID=A0A9P9DUD4_9PLEO|nr:hypothetical protein B0J11DRAFT_306723 [Dendryphion nanum]
MTKTIELGRAVIASADSGIQLWSTTLITLSPLERSFDTQALDHFSLVQLVHSGYVWVCRGNGLYLDIKLTTQGENLRGAELSQLANKLMNAPVWAQLELHTSLPADNGPCMFKDDRIRINICHTHDHAKEPSVKYHRIFSDVPFVDIKPPDGISTLGLLSVEIQMDIRKVEHRPSKMLSLGSVGPRSHNQTANLAIVQPKHRKEYGGRHASSELASMGPSMIQHQFPMNMDVMAALIDSALRVSACDLTPKLPPGLKIIVKNFSGSLASICPAIWSPGYLRAFAQRSHLMPTISRSLQKSASRKAEPSSLRDKLADLLHDRVVDQPGFTLFDNDDAPLDPKPINTINCRLWIYAHNHMPKTSKQHLKQFMELSSSADPVEVLAGPVRVLSCDGISGQGMRSSTVLYSISPATSAALLAPCPDQQRASHGTQSMPTKSLKRPFSRDQLSHDELAFDRRVKSHTELLNKNQHTFNRTLVTEQTAEKEVGNVEFAWRNLNSEVPSHGTRDITLSQIDACTAFNTSDIFTTSRRAIFSGRLPSINTNLDDTTLFEDPGAYSQTPFEESQVFY